MRFTYYLVSWARYNILSCYIIILYMCVQRWFVRAKSYTGRTTRRHIIVIIIIYYYKYEFRRLTRSPVNNFNTNDPRKLVLYVYINKTVWVKEVAHLYINQYP